MNGARRNRKINVIMRWMTKTDLPKVLSIEEDNCKFSCYNFAWTKTDFEYVLGQHSCVGMIAEIEKQIAGFIVYEIKKPLLHIMNLAVALNFRCRGVGTYIIGKTIDELLERKFIFITKKVHERNLPAQLFLREMGFRAVNVFSQSCRKTREDEYLMQYKYDKYESLQKGQDIEMEEFNK